MPASPLTLRIADADVQIVEYRGERVVTFKQIDTVHGRPEGTAKRNFNENEGRFVEGVDTVLIPASCRDEFRTFGIEVPNRGLRMFTRRGYFKLVKSLNDDLAWAIHGEMIDAYFAALGGGTADTARERIISAANDPREIRLAMNQSLRLAKMAGLDGVHALMAASAQTHRLTGHDTLAAMGITKLAAPEDERPLIPTAIGDKLGGLSGRAVNLLLLEHGFQEKDERDEWRATDKGREAGGHMVLVKKLHTEGTAYQLVWHRRIVETLRPLVNATNVVPLPTL